ncbi:MAG: Two-component sensor histidine kinase, contains HisKA and HATPase domain, partial [Devosia sp.]|nr:Two-component sensor histidine kinase, contains HisKA and HATPase domain [Devosia sp.]
MNMMDGIGRLRRMTRADWRVAHNVAVLVPLGLVLLAAVAALIFVQG